jgi:bifunctional enzyme CysN/CysC
LSLLRVVTCGSVDDGKSTLIGRLLHDTQQIATDHLATMKADSRRLGSGAEMNFALLSDGLTAEREQGITIDVAHLFFSTPKRSFIIADTPGHEQYTRNMVTGASRADLAVLLVDARKGIVRQTRRHLRIATLLGVRSAVLVVNKMDLISYDESRFSEIEAEFAILISELGLTRSTAIPVAATLGSNVACTCAETPWYRGPSLLRYLEGVPVDEALDAEFVMPVQWVNRTSSDFRGLCGLIASGTLAPGDQVTVLPGGQVSRVERIIDLEGDLVEAVAGESVTLSLTDALDCARGHVLAAPGNSLEVADRMEATIIWMHDAPLLPGRSYYLKVGTATLGASVTTVKHRIDIDTGAEIAATTLQLNDIGVVHVALDRPIAFKPYAESRDLGGFILIDRISNATSGAGLIRGALRRSADLTWQQSSVRREDRALLKAQRPKVVWFTGLSGAGKSTIANLVETKLHVLGKHTFLLDGDNLRHGLNKNLGFSDVDRVENIRRSGEVARLMADAGLIVLCAFISPFRAERRMVRSMFSKDEFIEVFVDVPLEEAERRDPKGLYRRARSGEIPNFTGIGSAYEVPESADIRISTVQASAEEAAELVLRQILRG